MPNYIKKYKYRSFVTTIISPEIVALQLEIET